MDWIDSSQQIHNSEEELLWDRNIPTSRTPLGYLFIVNAFFICQKYRAIDRAF